MSDKVYNRGLLLTLQSLLSRFVLNLSRLSYLSWVPLHPEKIFLNSRS